MPKKYHWTEAQDSQLRRMRTQGATWDDISAVLGVTRWLVIERGRRLGATLPSPDFIPEPEDPEREPLPAGHPRTWGAITADTVLDGMPYPLPVFRR